MCTVVAIKNCRSELPLIVAANRDELYARPTVGPRRMHDEPVVVAGLDAHKGGTWMGANALGIFVALTNQRQHEGADESRASRGEVVREALAERDIEGIDAVLGALDGRDYNGFNLLYGDASTLRVAYSRTERAAVEIEDLADGVWVLPNDRIGSPDFPKALRARRLVEPILDNGWPELAGDLRRLLADHERAPIEQLPAPPPGSVFTHEIVHLLSSICVHTPIYGTRSSTLIALSPGRVEHYLYADGPPCEAPFVEITELLR